MLVWKHCSGIAKMFFLDTIQIYFIMTKHYNIIHQKKHLAIPEWNILTLLGWKEKVSNKKVKNNCSETHKILKSPLTKHFHLQKTIFSVIKLFCWCVGGGGVGVCLFRFFSTSPRNYLFLKKHGNHTRWPQSNTALTFKWMSLSKEYR